MKKYGLLFLILSLCVLAGSGCGRQDEFAALERTTYESEYGYSLEIPADWSSREIDPAVVFYLPDGELSLSVSPELGGVEYYSMREVGEMLAENLAAATFAEYTAATAQVTEREAEPANGAATAEPASYEQTLQGTDAAGNALTLHFYIDSPCTGIRYYLIFLGATEAYDENAYIADGVIDSFTVTMTQDELYDLMMRVNQRGEYAPAPPAEDENAPSTDE